MSLDHESLKLEPKEKRLAGTENVSIADLKDHQLLLMLNGPIVEAVVPVLFQVQWNHLEEGEQEKVYFHPHCHHLKKKLE
jgi:hypothetical protein